jgi:hypothetical protein
MDFNDIIMQMSQEGHHLDNSFTINHLSFGPKANFKSIKEAFPDTDLQHPIDGFKRTTDKKDVTRTDSDGSVTKEKRPVRM